MAIERGGDTERREIALLLEGLIAGQTPEKRRGTL